MRAPPFGTKNGSATTGDRANASFIAVHFLLFSLVFCIPHSRSGAGCTAGDRYAGGHIVMMRWFPHPCRGLAGIVAEEPLRSAACKHATTSDGSVVSAGGHS